MCVSSLYPKCIGSCASLFLFHSSASAKTPPASKNLKRKKITTPSSSNKNPKRKKKKRDDDDFDFDFEDDDEEEEEEDFTGGGGGDLDDDHDTSVEEIKCMKSDLDELKNAIEFLRSTINDIAKQFAFPPPQAEDGVYKFQDQRKSSVSGRRNSYDFLFSPLSSVSDPALIMNQFSQLNPATVGTEKPLS